MSPMERYILTGQEMMDLNLFAEVVHQLQMDYMAGPLRNSSQDFDTRKLRLLDLLQLFTHAKCSDPKDSIFALHHMSVDLADLKVDYVQDVFELYFAVAKHYLTQDDLPILLDCAASRQDADHSLVASLAQVEGRLLQPSWMPDWTRSISEHSRHGKESYPNPIEPGRLGVYRDRITLTEKRSLLLEGRIVSPCSGSCNGVLPAKGSSSECAYCEIGLSYGAWGRRCMSFSASFVFLTGVELVLALIQFGPASSQQAKYSLLSTMDTERIGGAWDIEGLHAERQSFELM